MLIFLEPCNKEQLLMRKLVAFMQEEVYYTVHRLLAADVKELYVGPRFRNVESLNIPELQNATQHPTKGGMKVMDYLTFNWYVDRWFLYR